MTPWIVCVLCALIILKPQEFIPALEGVPLLYITFGLATVSAVLDITWRRLKPSLAPQVPWVLAFLGWAVLTTALKSPSSLGERGSAIGIVGVIYLLVAVGAGSARGLRLISAAILGCAVVVATVAILQGCEPFVCMVPDDPADWDGKGMLSSDGRSCTTDLDCLKDRPEAQVRYRCERPGPLRTATQGGRVRYRGSLADPNELSLMICMSIPFAFTLAEGRLLRRRRKPEGEALASARRVIELPVLLTDRLIQRAAAFLRMLPVAAMVGAAGLVVVLSRSRTGLIVYLIVLGLYFIRRLGAWGIVAGCLVGPPMLLFGGRSGTEAEESAADRLEVLLEGFEMIKQSRGIGIGVGQFVNESALGLTAHNAYLLAAAETGLVGVCLFGIALYVSLKVPLSLWFGDYKLGGVARFAPAIFVSLCGALAGIFFLSWSYKDVLYIALGVSAALHGAARAEDGRVSVRVSVQEIALVCAGMVALLVALNVAVRLHG